MKVTLTEKEAQAIMLDAVSAKLGLKNQHVTEMKVSSYDDREYLRIELEEEPAADGEADTPTDDKPAESWGEE